MTAEDPKIASEQGRRTGEHPRWNCEDKPCPASISFIGWCGIKIRNAELSEFAVPNIVSIDTSSASRFRRCLLPQQNGQGVGIGMDGACMP